MRHSDNGASHVVDQRKAGLITSNPNPNKDVINYSLKLAEYALNNSEHFSRMAECPSNASNALRYCSYVRMSYYIN